VESVTTSKLANLVMSAGIPPLTPLGGYLKNKEHHV
jgi:hypothetical protein